MKGLSQFPQFEQSDEDLCIIEINMTVQVRFLYSVIRAGFGTWFFLSFKIIDFSN